MNSREVVNYVRDLIDFKEKSSVGFEGVVQELEHEAEYGLGVIQNLIDGMAKQRRLWLTNDMDARIEAGDVNGKYSVERLKEIRELFENFSAWVEAPIVVRHAYTEETEDGQISIPEIAIPPIVIVSRRENPPVNWGSEALKQSDDLPL